MAPPQPRQLYYLYEWFNEISRGRQQVAALAWTEIDAWCRISHTELEPWEIDVILTLDRVWLQVCNEKGHPFEEIEDEQKQLELKAAE
jgi:hypothetical protein